MMKFLKCSKCGKILGVAKSSACDTYCCGIPMEVMTPNTSDGAHEKHVPVVTVEGNIVTARVGEVDHPMLPEHFIEWIALETSQGAQRKVLNPGEAPVLTFALAEGETPLAAYEHCNLHGLWMKEL